jgi:hypothetical protein
MEDNIKRFLAEHNIKRFVAWGHKLHTHTHSYIHNGFILVFKHLGYPTLWLDKNDDISTIDFEGSLFLTEGQVYHNMPCLASCYYIVHNIPYYEPLEIVPKSHKLTLQVFTKDKVHDPNLICLQPCMYYGYRCIFMPWATDLLPHEIDENIRQINTIAPTSPPELNFIGMGTPPWEHVAHYCNKNGIKYRQIGGYSNNNVNVHDNIKLIQQSIVAPAIQTDWQIEHGYIPCRIFKNISYGKMGMTNSEVVYHLFQDKILYSSNIHQLMDMGLQFESNSMEYKQKIIISLMECVRDHHTYLNRIHSIFHCFDLLSSE